MDVILNFLSNFTGTMFEIGTKVIEFIMTPANAICLIPVVSFLFVMGVKMVRTLYKG